MNCCWQRKKEALTRHQPLKRGPRNKDQDERDFDAWLRYQGCVVCAKHGNVVTVSDVAHVATSDGPRAGKLPLCPWHHRRPAQGGGPESHHSLGNRFWVVHFNAVVGDFEVVDTWVNYFRNRYQAEMKKDGK